ncbi:MAG TPA: hypothetical protein VNB06_06065 [Thermoanaerobaculia bacterium]|nr:hypothetical protein [Thermoanaerobaculia bacterium]
MGQRVLVADNDVRSANKLCETLQSCGAEATYIPLELLRRRVRGEADHLETANGEVCWNDIDLLVLDARDQGVDPEGFDMPFAGLEVTLRMKREDGPWRRATEDDDRTIAIVGYSTSAEDPLIRVAWMEADLLACYRFVDLLDLTVANEVLNGYDLPDAQPEPTVQDYLTLGLAEEAFHGDEASRLVNVVWDTMTEGATRWRHGGALWRHVVGGVSALGSGDDANRARAANTEWFRSRIASRAGWNMDFRPFRSRIRAVTGYPITSWRSS